MLNLSFIAQMAYEGLENDHSEVTPKTFAAAFCKLVKEYGLQHDECELFEKMLFALENEDGENFSRNDIDNIYDLADKLFKKHAQDRGIILRNTKDISKLLVIINDHLMDAITGNKDEVNEIIKIRNEMEEIKIAEGLDHEIVAFKDKLVDAAGNIETHVNNVTDKLEVSSQEVESLRNKIKELEDELSLAKKEHKLDHLTQVLNRGSYEKAMEEFEQNYLDEAQDYAIVFMDLDHFKNINDTYGHDGGDFILQTFSQVVKRLTRADNVIGRYGGEEFIVAFKYFNKEELLKYLARVKEVFSHKKLSYKEHKISVTFSAGVELRSNQDSYDATIAKADENLYKAKDTGRNKIVLPFSTTEL